jgi:hypothetical protein
MWKAKPVISAFINLSFCDIFFLSLHRLHENVFICCQEKPEQVPVAMRMRNCKLIGGNYIFSTSDLRTAANIYTKLRYIEPRSTPSSVKIEIATVTAAGNFDQFVIIFIELYANPFLITSSKLAYFVLIERPLYQNRY